MARIDGQGLVALVNARCGCSLVLDGYADGGESGGAAYVRWPNGDRSVLSVAPLPPARVELIGSVLAGARHGGIPTPRYQLVVPIDDGAVLVQERLPGRPPERIDVETMDAIIRLTDRFAGLLAPRPDVPPIDLHLRHSGTDLFRHETLATHSTRSRRLLTQIRDAADNTDEVAGDDLVHCDLTPGNVLFDAGAISAVIDWHGANGLARGDRAFGLVVLRWDLAWGGALDPSYPGIDPPAISRLDDRLDSLPEQTLRRYWASMSLRMVDWTIRRHGPEDVDHQLAFAATRLT
ncbi:MAG TPA: phosphotransferase [Acidimicrobiales bacterium]|nr:phosphotransferase [Acidimicrobiales bacterium]